MFDHQHARSTRTLVATMLSALCVSVATGHLSAEPVTPEGKSAAREWARKGTKEYADGDFAAAITSLTKAESLFHATTHVLYLARCHEKVLHLADARELYLSLIHEQVTDSMSAAMREAQAAAAEELRALEPRVPYVTLLLEGGDAEGVEVTDNGQRLPPAAIGIRRPVNPGKHQFIASGSGVRGELTVTIAESENITSTLKLEPHAEAVPSAPLARPSTVAPKPTGKTAESGGDRVMLYTGIGVGTLGVAGLVTGTVLLVSAGGKHDDRSALARDCSTANGTLWCSADQAERIERLQDDEQTARTASCWSFAIGGVALAAGGTLVLFDILGQPSPQKSGRRVVPYASPQSVGFRGIF